MYIHHFPESSQSFGTGSVSVPISQKMKLRPGEVRGVLQSFLLDEGSNHYVPQAKSGSLHAFVNKVLLKQLCSCIHDCLWLLLHYNCEVTLLRQRPYGPQSKAKKKKKKVLHSPLQKKPKHTTCQLSLEVTLPPSSPFTFGLIGRNVFHPGLQQAGPTACLSFPR